MTPARFRTALAVVALAAVAVHLPALRGGFVFDDHFALLGHPGVTGAAPWREVFTRDWFGHPSDAAVSIGTWRPLVTAMFRVEWSLGRGAPWVFHLVSALVHGAVTALVGAALVRAKVDARAALFAAMVFAVHALHTEAVVSIVGRAELVMALFALLTLGAHARDDLRGRALAPLFLFAALASKESALLTLPLLALYDALVDRPWRDRLSRYAALSLAPIAMALARRAVLGELRGFSAHATYNPLVTLDAGARALNTVRLLGRAAQLLVAPFDLLADYSAFPLARAPDALTVAGLVFVVACTVALVRGRRGPVASFAGAVLLLVGLGAVGAFVPLPVMFAERFWYLPSAAAVALVAVGASAVPARLRVLVGAVAALWCVMLASATVLRTRDWHDDASIYRATLELAPDNAQALGGYGAVLAAQGHPDRAAALCQRALHFAPHAAAVWGCFGSALAQLGHRAEAIAAFEHMRAEGGGLLADEVNFAIALAFEGRVAEARAQRARLARWGELSPAMRTALDRAFAGR